LCAVDNKAWQAEVDRNDAFLGKLGARLPDALREQHTALLDRLRHGTS
jgi:GTP-dependent phosphoenolpyruvate carboxykinase